MFFDWPDVVTFSGTKCHGNYPFFPNNWPIWQTSFLSSLSATNFLITLTTVISKKISKFLNYPLQNIKKFTHFKIFPTIFTVNYSKVLDKHPKNSFARRVNNQSPNHFPYCATTPPIPMNEYI